MSLDSEYGRILLKEVTADVKRYLPDIRLREAWVWCVGRDHWEFHFHNFYWHGSAGSAYEARASGWAAYLKELGIAGYADPPENAEKQEE